MCVMVSELQFLRTKEVDLDTAAVDLLRKACWIGDIADTYREFIDRIWDRFLSVRTRTSRRLRNTVCRKCRKFVCVYFVYESEKLVYFLYYCMRLNDKESLCIGLI